MTDADPPLTLTEILTRYGHTWGQDVKSVEPHHWVLGGFELYDPDFDYEGDIESVAGMWNVYGSTVLPGRHTMPNGDPGYPDDVDVWHAGAFFTLREALLKIGHLLMDEYVGGDWELASAPLAKVRRPPAADLPTVLDAIEEYLDRHADADQPAGSDHPIPNEAMRLLAQLREARQR